MTTANPEPDATPARVLVTGADGFIGSFLCPALEKQGMRVRRAVWRITDAQPAAHEWIVAGDIGPNTDWRGLLGGVDVVVHLANRAHVMSEPVSDPLAEFRRVNTQGTLNLATQAQAQGIRRFVFVSSVGVHGETTRPGTFYTEESPFLPTNDYTRSKWEAELGLQEMVARSGWDVVVVRPPLVYGPGVPGNFLRLMHLVNRRLPLPLAAVKNHRSFVGISNLVGFLSACAVHPSATNQTFLISDNEDVSTPFLIRLLGHYLDVRTYLFPFPVFSMTWAGKLLGKSRAVASLIGSLQVNCKKAQQVLGWHPVMSVEDQLTQTAAWYKKAYS
ncbi:MAG: NAD-dependent epimerase/dehydratase family protein [Anaerolineaceae bacterium]|nr:NAD-dependent epimerase/dehydratase family protein [Anaerolineaceae bacterium]